MPKLGWSSNAPAVAMFTVVAVGLLAATPLLDRSLRSEARRRAGDELATIAELKAREIVRWRADQVRIARFAAAYPSVRRAAQEADRRGAVDPALAAHVTEVLGQVAHLQGFTRIALLRDGAEVAGWARAGGRATAPPPELVARALASPDRAASELRLDPGGRPHLDVAAALARGDGPTVLFARADAGAVFDEVLERWPVPSETAGGALAHLEGDVIHLVVPDRSVAAGFPRIERIPASDLRRPVVAAFRGATGIVEGLDYQGTPILVASREIAGTSWRVQAKIARSEVEAPLQRPIRIIYGLAGALLAAAAAVLAVSWWQRRARAALDVRLDDARERLALAVSATHAIWDYDLASGVLHVDPPWPLGGGPPVSVLEGTPDEVRRLVVHPDDVPAVRARFEPHFRGETPLVDVEHRARLPGGPVWLRVRGRVTRRGPDGAPLRFVAVVSDVTERRAMQAELELSHRLAGLGTLAAGVAHEINNPLSSVCANLEAIAEKVVDRPELAAAVAEARDGAARVRAVVRGLRAFSQRGGGERGPADVRAELEAALRLARNEIRHRARLEVRLEDVPLVEAGAHELGQVFLNLLTNAAQAIPEGHADENVIAVEASRAADGSASIRISDTGSGIPPQALERIFEPFYSTKPAGVGLGLGLAIAHRIVTAAGGRIDVETQVGRGTTFAVTLPPARSIPAPAAAPAAPAPAPPPDARRTVLIVDDDPLVARSVVRTLAERWEVSTAASGPEALARLEAGERFDALVCDLMMPQMTGMELRDRIAARDPALARRMVFITGGAFTEAAARFLADPKVAHLEKPFDAERLRDAVARAAAA